MVRDIQGTYLFQLLIMVGNKSALSMIKLNLLYHNLTSENESHKPIFCSCFDCLKAIHLDTHYKR